MSAHEVWQLLREARVKYKCNMFCHYLMRTLDVIYSALKEWREVFALRVDLHFANDYWGGNPDFPTCFQRADPQAITRFFESLKSQLREEHKRKRRRGKPSLPKYIWVREQDSNEYHPHYHIVLFFNKDIYAFLGDFTNYDADNMATRIERAWCSALALPFPDYATRAHFPKKGGYVFGRKSATIHSETYRKFLLRIGYFWKMRTKLVGGVNNNFGCSRSERVELPADGIIEGL